MNYSTLYQSFIDLHRKKPIAHHTLTPLGKINPDHPVSQIVIPKRLTISHANSIADFGNKREYRTDPRYLAQGAFSASARSILAGWYFRPG
ncbi:hypothetical protein [Nostoc sp. TCL26-01]|uniref:hypothetical protein n=1 Tax=Nostoc sp. TCL26-01 TaxID=2576904 RepID=UPI0015BCA25E|nr:hypothetical protein [Nostoc sp. TCL26-01]QLE59687.1 hypothetical protein FD725_30055 [Nostoc sp. TCL26-01]